MGRDFLDEIVSCVEHPASLDQVEKGFQHFFWFQPEYQSFQESNYSTVVMVETNFNIPKFEYITAIYC